MADQLGNVAVGATIHIWFTTHLGSGAAGAPASAFEAADVKLYKDGSATQRTSEAGWTMTSPFDSIVGLHQLAIDLSDNTDAGFYAAGSKYTAILSPDETVDGLAVAAVLAHFTIGPPAVNVSQWLGTAAATPTVAGVPEVDVTHWLGTACSTPTTNGVPEVDVIHLRGDSQSAIDLKDFADDGYDPSTNKVTGVVLVDTTTTVTGGATASALATLQAFVDTEVAAILAAVDTEVATIVSATAAAAIRTALGLASANLDTQLGDLPTNAELATALGTADDAILAAIAALNNLSAAQVNAEVDTALSDYDGPTNAELATALAAADDAVLAAIAALNNLSQANIRTAVGLGSANLDTQLDALPTAAENAAALLASAVEGAVTVLQSLRLANAAAGAKLSGAATTTVSIRDLADTKDRVVATVDADGNRSAVTRDLT